MNKPKEFWINEPKVDLVNNTVTVALIMDEPFEGLTHVVEKSAYDKLVNTLSFYAKKEHHTEMLEQKDGKFTVMFGVIGSDLGQLARETLKELGELNE
jgi:hypothetical protein